MSQYTEQQAYVAALGITEIVYNTTEFQDDFMDLLYDSLTGGKHNMVFDDSGYLVCDGTTGNIIYV